MKATLCLATHYSLSRDSWTPPRARALFRCKQIHAPWLVAFPTAGSRTPAPTRLRQAGPTSQSGALAGRHCYDSVAQGDFGWHDRVIPESGQNYSSGSVPRRGAVTQGSSHDSKPIPVRRCARPAMAISAAARNRRHRPAEAAKHDRPRRTARKLNDFGRTLTMLARMVVVPLSTWVILTVLSLSVFAGAASWYCLRSRPDKEE